MQEREINMKTLICAIACLSVFMVGCQKKGEQALPEHITNVSTQYSLGISPHKPEPVEPGRVEIEADDSTWGSVRADTNLYDIVFDDVPLLEAVRQFSRVTGALLIATPTELQGTVTVNLTEVPWKPALESILRMFSFQLVEETPGSGVYSILKRPPGQPEPLVTEALFFSTPGETEEIAEAIRNVWGTNASGTARVGVIPSRRAIILRATKPAFAEIRHILDGTAPRKSRE